MYNQNNCPPRNPYYLNGPSREFRTRARKKDGPRIPDSLFDAVARLAGKQNLQVSRPEKPILPHGPHVIINSKRCRISITKPFFPGKHKDGMWGSVVEESLACNDFCLFICAPGEVLMKTYVMPNDEVCTLLSESTGRKGLKFPYLSGPETDHKQYLEAWHLLA